MSHLSIEHESPKPKLSTLTRNYVIRTAQIILKANSNLSEATIEVLLEAHRKDPRRLAEHLNLALPVEIPRKPNKVSRAEIQT
jgi:hypothetical protein